MTELAITTDERRPIRARELRIFQRIASVLVRRGISANAISMVGMVCGVAGGATLAATAYASDTCSRGLWLVSAALVQLRLLANMLDGIGRDRIRTSMPAGRAV